MDTPELYQYFKDRQKEFVALLHRLVSMPTFQGALEVNRFLDVVVPLFEPFYPRIRRMPTSKGDIAVFDPASKSRNCIVLLAHADTVCVSGGLVPIRIRKNRFYGTGCYDMKNGISLFYFVQDAFHKLDLRPSHGIKVILTPDEETGSECAMPFLLKECRNASAVLIPEPSCPDGGVKIRRKGILLIKAELKGKAAHSGIDPEKGDDANRGLVRLVEEIEKRLEKYSDVTFNPGLMAGGVRTNVISPESVLQGELRSFSTTALKEIALELKKIKRLGSVHVKISVKNCNPALEDHPRNQHLYALAQNIAASLNFDLPCCSTGGSSDGSRLSASGIPVLDGLGMRGGGAHSSDEYVELSDFPFRATLFTRLCMEI